MLKKEEAVQEQHATVTERDQLLLEASALLQADSWAGSIEHYTRFLAHPHVEEVGKLSLAEVYHKRGHCLEMSGNMEAAEDDYTAGIALAGGTEHSDGFALYYHRGRLRIGLGDIDGGKEDLGMALALQERESHGSSTPTGALLEPYRDRTGAVPEHYRSSTVAVHWSLTG